jgi:flavin reductase (DIM6/NTAB) family NADH-FMN oxidoreductase RutF
MKHSLGADALVYPTPVWVVGTYDQDGKPNAMTASWGGICCSQPPCVAVALRKATYSYAAIVKRRAFTISVPSEEHLKHADYFGIATGAVSDKFAATGLTAAASQVVDAPYVDEFPMVLECRVVAVHELGLHTQFVGEILDIKVDQSVLGDRGLPEMRLVRPILFDPKNWTYYSLGEMIGKAFEDGNEI